MTRQNRLIAVAALVALATLLLLPRPGGQPPPHPTQRQAPALAPPPLPTRPASPTPSPTPPRIELHEPSRLRGVSASCRDVAIMEHHFDPPAALDAGAWSDRLGSRAVHVVHDMYLPRQMRHHLDNWGLTPAWLGTQLQQVSPWLALAALDEEHMWDRARENHLQSAFREQVGLSPYDDEAQRLRTEDPSVGSIPVAPDRTPALQLADALAGSDDVGLRARLYRVRVLQEGVMHPDLSREERRAVRAAADREAMDLLHDTDDPDLLAAVAASLVWSSVPTTPADDARILEVMELLPPNVGRHLALRRMLLAELDGDDQARRFWWEQYQPVVAYCADVPPEERESEGCWCVQIMADENGSYFHHIDGTQPQTLRGRLALAGAHCREEGHYPEDHDVDPASDFGRCVQEELGDDVVLGRDVDLAYRFVSHLPR